MAFITSGGSGGSASAVAGPVVASSTDNALVRWDGTTGRLVQNSVGILDDSGNLSGIVNVSASGIVTAGNGTVAVPSIQHSGDSDTGVYFLAAGNAAGLTSGGIRGIEVAGSSVILGAVSSGMISFWGDGVTAQAVTFNPSVIDASSTRIVGNAPGPSGQWLFKTNNVNSFIMDPAGNINYNDVTAGTDSTAYDLGFQQTGSLFRRFRDIHAGRSFVVNQDTTNPLTLTQQTAFRASGPYGMIMGLGSAAYPGAIAICSASAASGVPGASIDCYVSKGTFAAPTQALQFDNLHGIEVSPYNGVGTFEAGTGAFTGYAAINCTASENHTTTAMGNYWDFTTTADGTVTQQSMFQVRGAEVTIPNGNGLKFSNDMAPSPTSNDVKLSAVTQGGGGDKLLAIAAHSVDVGTATSTHKYKVNINGTEYYILLKLV